MFQINDLGSNIRYFSDRNYTIRYLASSKLPIEEFSSSTNTDTSTQTVTFTESIKNVFQKYGYINIDESYYYITDVDVSNKKITLFKESILSSPSTQNIS